MAWRVIPIVGGVLSFILAFSIKDPEIALNCKIGAGLWALCSFVAWFGPRIPRERR